MFCFCIGCIFQFLHVLHVVDFLTCHIGTFPLAVILQIFLHVICFFSFFVSACLRFCVYRLPITTQHLPFHISPFLLFLCLLKCPGYCVQPIDVFACGVVFYIMANGGPPWRRALPSDSHFVFAMTKGIRSLLSSQGKGAHPDALSLLSQMLDGRPGERISVAACLTHPRCSHLQEPVPTRGVSSLAAEEGWIRLHPGADIWSSCCRLSSHPCDAVRCC